MSDRLRDPDSGLLNGAFFEAELPVRVAAARRLLRPVSVVLVTLGDESPRTVRAVGDVLRRRMREADTVCRLDDGGIGLVLEDTPETGAVWSVERIRRALAAEGVDVALWAGVACYPAHALDAATLLARAGEALRTAREWGTNRIEVATSD